MFAESAGLPGNGLAGGWRVAGLPNDGTPSLGEIESHSR
jgi:hypothetical protein